MKKKIIIILAILIFAFIISCNISESVGNSTIAIWTYNNTNNYPFGAMITFDLWRNSNTIGYEVHMSNVEEMPIVTSGEFKTNDIKPFNEWNECNIKFPNDTTISWLFRFEGKNIPKDISFLYDTNNIEGVLVFWDSVSNIKYYLKKELMYLV